MIGLYRGVWSVFLISLPFAQVFAEEVPPSMIWANPAGTAQECETDVAQALPSDMPYTPTDPVQLFGDRHENAPRYPWLSRSYSLFMSPASYGMEYWERCPSTPWTPRGIGVARRTSSFRMDYRPHVLQSTYSKHGPALYPRIDLPPCCGLDCCGCESCFWGWYHH